MIRKEIDKLGVKSLLRLFEKSLENRSLFCYPDQYYIKHGNNIKNKDLENITRYTTLLGFHVIKKLCLMVKICKRDACKRASHGMLKDFKKTAKLIRKRMELLESSPTAIN